MKCVLCNRQLLAAAVSIPTRGGSIAYGPKCARKAGLTANVGPRTSHVKKTQPRPGKQPSRAIAIQDKHTPDMFQEDLTQ